MKNCKIPEVVERILDGYGVTATIYADEGYIEIEGRTSHDGDMIHSLYVKQDEFNDLHAWSKAWHDMCEGFNPWDETALWCEDGVPVRTPFDDANDLYDDINDYKRDILKGIDRDLHGLCQGGDDMTGKNYDVESDDTTICPVCGSEVDWTMGDYFQDEGAFIRLNCKCDKCGSELWFSYYLTTCFVEKDGRYE